MLQVERHGTLDGIEHQKGIAHAARRRLGPPQALAHAGRFDLDDLGAHLGELQGAVGRGENLAQVNYADSLERQAHRTLSVIATSATLRAISAAGCARSPSDAL